MNTPTVFQHVGLYGQSPQDDPDFSGPVPKDFTFNSLIGCCMDRFQRIWVCDTGNNRVIVLDKDLNLIIRVLYAPQMKAKGEGGTPFRMPFHICQHPVNNQMYITDMGNSRVVVMDYTAQKISYSHVFGNQPSNGGEPLQDPNGITIVQNKGKCFVHVNDEFFHTEQDKLRNRCVRYTDAGEYVDEFRGVIEPDGERYDIYWPQGLSSDHQGNLYLANTGNYQIIKCKANAPVGPHYNIQAEEPIVQHVFSQPRGIGIMNIMRDVSVIGKHIFVPDQILNTISVYNLQGKLTTVLSSIRPSWHHGDNPVHSVTDPLYYTLEDTLLLNPYVICQGENEHTFFVTEPFTSRLLKLHIPRLEGVAPPMTLLAALGARRNQLGHLGSDPQFNCVTAVIGFKHHAHKPESVVAAAQLPANLPAWLQYNPWQQWYSFYSAVATQQYQYWVGNWMDKWLAQTPATHELTDIRLNLDAGNWRFKSYIEEKNDFSAVKENPLHGYFLPGNLSMATYYPSTPLLGQICPGTPLLFVANFDYGTISMYQIGPNAKLLNYGTPFGFYGQVDGCMRGPQGMKVTDEGEIFIVDSLNNRIGKWQILQTGQVVFIKNFAWVNKNLLAGTFTPTDIAIDAKKRLFVTDQFNDRICVFDRDGQSLWSYGVEGYWEQGEAEGERFMLPTSLAIDGDKLILNDLVNRALKLFSIEEHGLKFIGGISLFKLTLQEGGVWMPYFMYAHKGQVYIADSTYNVVQVYSY